MLALPLGACSSDIAALIDAFKEAVTAECNLPFETVRFIAAFRTAAAGFDDIHYPRVRKPGTEAFVPPDPDGNGFAWFVENERQGTGRFHCLPDLESLRQMPILEQRE